MSELIWLNVLRRREIPTCRVFVGSLKAGGVGIDLVAGSVVIDIPKLRSLVERCKGGSISNGSRAPHRPEKRVCRSSNW